MKIKLKKYFNSSMLINPDKAKSFYEKIKEVLKKEEEVVLDFAGIQVTTLVFLYVLFTNLWNEYGNELKNKLTIKNASQGFFNQMIYLKDNYKELKTKFLGVHQNFEIAYIG
ncbi:STAS-like domain-containing protein [uncultured Cetobacterium sp.]|uniref:STAS-like domain-containing protein n=1 Tax=uncultured Cetobacterium sp. TaxID=527638 RepID=UPI0025E5D255|nr:STAS-like domain-containing protein [uncultured Cetobacterium sp.]